MESQIEEGEFEAKVRNFLANEGMFVTSKSYFASQCQATQASPITIRNRGILSCAPFLDINDGLVLDTCKEYEYPLNN